MEIEGEGEGEGQYKLDLGAAEFIRPSVRPSVHRCEYSIQRFSRAWGWFAHERSPAADSMNARSFPPLSLFLMTARPWGQEETAEDLEL